MTPIRPLSYAWRVLLVAAHIGLGGCASAPGMRMATDGEATSNQAALHTINLCRSPMAEYWLRQQVPGLSVSSAGLNALVGQHVDPTTQLVLQSHGLDASAHRARPLAIWMVQNASLVLTAELRHKQHIERLYPHTRGRVFRMDEHLQQDIADPHRKSQALHELSFAHICQALQPWVHKIEALGYTPQTA